ncbi:PA2779 family protein [Thermodesulfobacteriota bacterium]
MKTLRRLAKPGSLFLAILMITIFTPYQIALAKLISTETVIELGRAHEARMYVNSVLAHEEVKTALISQGIDIKEAEARIFSLTDAEIVSLADQIETAPAGGSAVGVIVGAAVLAFIVLLITDILGYTDIFPFIKK